MTDFDARPAVVCARCHRPMKHGKRPTLNPGEVRHDAHGHCHACYVTITRTPQPRGRCRTGRLPIEYDIDEAIIARALAGHKPEMNPAERSHLIAYLTGKQDTARQIAERLGCTTRTVQRHRAQLRVTPMT